MPAVLEAEESEVGKFGANPVVLSLTFHAAAWSEIHESSRTIT
jgi:hypothetical protein